MAIPCDASYSFLQILEVCAEHLSYTFCHLHQITHPLTSIGLLLATCKHLQSR